MGIFIACIDTCAAGETPHEAWQRDEPVSVLNLGRLDVVLNEDKGWVPRLGNPTAKQAALRKQIFFAIGRNLFSRWND